MHVLADEGCCGGGCGDAAGARLTLPRADQLLGLCGEGVGIVRPVLTENRRNADEDKSERLGQPMDVGAREQATDSEKARFT